MEQGLIPARQMGDFVGEVDDGRCYYQHKLCPGCGQLICDTATHCQDCAGELRAEARERAGDAERLRIRRERQVRYDAALAAGWTAAELCPNRDDGNHDADPLPTWEEIVNGRRRW